MEIYSPSLRIEKVLKPTIMPEHVSNSDKQKDETPFSPTTISPSSKAMHSVGKAYSQLLNETMIEAMSSIQVDQK
jgi:hypothetical protein